MINYPYGETIDACHSRCSRGCVKKFPLYGADAVSPMTLSHNYSALLIRVRPKFVLT